MAAEHSMDSQIARAGVVTLGASLILMATASLSAPNAESDIATESATPAVPVVQPLEEVIVEAPEPRYVAPTRRDRIGRIWAPVYINNKGPFRMVLDTGANRSGVIASVAEKLHLTPDASSKLMLHGVTGSAAVSTIRVDSVLVGDVLLKASVLPILPDALGGAEGILGGEGLVDRRVFIDFRNDLIIIARSHNQRAAPGYVTIPFEFERGRLLVVDAVVGNVHASAIIDTGGQVSVANRALRRALSRRSARNPSVDQIEGVTKEIQEGEGFLPPRITFGELEIRSSHMTFADMDIFKHWHLTDQPALLIGMDVIGQLDTMIIDYRRRELQLRMPRDR
jgi:Aspartyl protease